MPHFTVGNRRMTNVPVPGGSGEYIQGIRKNTDLGIEDFTQGAPASADYDMAPVRPLRYTPGLKCDAHLESLRPSRDPKNQPIQVILEKKFFFQLQHITDFLENSIRFYNIYVFFISKKGR